MNMKPSKIIKKVLCLLLCLPLFVEFCQIGVSATSKVYTYERRLYKNTPYIVSDVDSNSKININDVAWINMYLVSNLKLPKMNYKAAAETTEPFDIIDNTDMQCLIEVLLNKD